MTIRGYLYSFLTLLIIGGGVAGYVYYRIEQNKKAVEIALGQYNKALDDEDYDAAQAALQEALARVRIRDERIQLRRELLNLMMKNGRWNEAKSEAQYILEEYPEHYDAAATANYCLGRFALEKESSFEDARKYFLAVVDDHADSVEAPAARVGLAELQERQGDRVSARRQLDTLVNSGALHGEPLDRAEQLLGRLNLDLMKSRQLQEGDITYKIEKSDTIGDIAKAHKLTPELLMACNNLDPRRLVVGSKIKIPNVDFSIHVDKFTNTLTVKNHGGFFIKYPVRTGRYDDETPVGDFIIHTKLVDPKWNDPNTGKVYPPNDPLNELGTRWMAFEGTLLGIHGTIRPETIGKYTSNGCVGMLKEDVEELFDLVPIGTPITITGSQNPKIKEQSN
ncbi:L,D-transpeptidase family protein [Candidatus Sumerlaeota bacterium]|nr:L,D-transpeptidase family protein [Candidatus Sumerlaeota bacterium]